MNNKFGLVLALVLVCGASFLLTVGLRSCHTASKIADQTVFNASKLVYTYEQFYAKHNQYQQYCGQLRDAEEQLKGVTDRGSQEYNNLVTEIQGVRNMKRRIAGEYNAMSQVAYQSVCKGRGLPETLSGD